MIYLLVFSIIINFILLIYLFNKPKQKNYINNNDNIKDFLNIIFNNKDNNIMFRDEDCKIWNNANCHIVFNTNTGEEIIMIDLK